MKVLYYLLALFVFLHSGSAVTEYYVRSTTSTDCPAEPCLTLNEYAEKDFTSNTAFIFLDGEHYLDIPLYIFLKSAISLRGTSNVVINLAQYAYILVVVSQEIEMSLLEIQYREYQGDDKNDELNSALFLQISVNVTLTNVTFRKLPGADGTFMRAVMIYQTNVNLTNCSSYNGIAKTAGGAVYIQNGTAYFAGVNFFAFNRGDLGAAIYMEWSLAVFNETNTFCENRGRPGKFDLEPEAIHAVNSTVAFQGEVNFIGNSALFGGSSDDGRYGKMIEKSLLHHLPLTSKTN